MFVLAGLNRNAAMKNAIGFVLHTLVAMLASVLLGFVLGAIAGTILGRVGPQHWTIYRLATDVP
jgi:hypothetical protein